MVAAARRAISRTRGALAVAACALVAHAALYHTLLPSDAAHGYFAWYEPVVGGLSALSILALAVLLVAGFLGARGRVIGALKDALRPGGVPGTRAIDSIARLSIVSLGLLAVQESLERSLASGAPTLALFTPAQWLFLLAVLFALAAGLVLATRSCVKLLVAAFAERRHGRSAPSVLVPRPPRPLSPRRPKPLASGGALRAPPLLVR